MRYACCDERRLQAVQEAGVLNGIEYVEVSDSEAPPGLRQRTLFVRLLLGPAGLGTPNVVIDGRRAHPRRGRVGRAGDAAARRRGCRADGGPRRPRERAARPHRLAPATSPATRSVSSRAAAATSRRPGFDPLLAAVEFSFKVECPTDFDCAPVCDCPPEAGRRAVDRLPRQGLPVVPLAHARPPQPARPRLDGAGHARRRHRARRAARLRRGRALVPPGRGRDRGVPADRAAADVAAPPRAARRLRRARGRERPRVGARLRRGRGRRARPRDAAAHARPRRPGRGRARRAAPPRRAREGRRDVRDRRAGRALPLARAVRLLDVGRRRLLPPPRRDRGHARRRPPRAEGGRRARARGGRRAGDRQPGRRRPGEARRRPPDARRRRRATRPAGSSPTRRRTTRSTSPRSAWDEADALPFPLCISVEERPELVVAEAWGNIVLADHGRTIAAERLGDVPGPVLDRVPDDVRPVRPGADRAGPDPLPADAREARPSPRRGPAPTHAVAEGPVEPGSALEAALALAHLRAGRARLARGARLPLPGRAGGVPRRPRRLVGERRRDRGAAPARGRDAHGLRAPRSAAATIAADPRAARPAVALEGTLLGATEPWAPQLDLLGSGGDAAEFVVEVEHDGAATLRFGDGVHGRRPEEGTVFDATYRVGNGTRRQRRRRRDRPRRDGTAAASSRAVEPAPRRAAASTRRRPTRSAATRPRRTSSSSAPSPRTTTRRSAERNPRVQRAAATFRWTGLVAHRLRHRRRAPAAAPVDEEFETDLRAPPRAVPDGRLRPRGRRAALRAARRRAPRLRRARLLPRAREGGRARRALEPDAPRRHARLLPSRPVLVRPARLPVRDRRGGAERPRRPVRERDVVPAPARRRLERARHRHRSR